MRKLIMGILSCIALAALSGCGAKSTSVMEGSTNSGEGQVVGAEGSFLFENTDAAADAALNDILAAEDSDEIIAGAVSGNIVNSGIACENGGWIYYYNRSDGNKLYRIDAAGVSEPVGNITGAIDINVLNDYIIYQSGSIYRYNMDTGELVKLVEGTCRNVIVYDGVVYYLKSDNDVFRIHSVMTDGTGDTVLSECISSYLNISDGKLYYINGTDEGRIHCMNTDGSGDVQITSFGGIEEMVVEGSMIYYVNGSGSGNELWKINTDGTGDSEVYGNECRSINVSEDMIYFRDVEKQTLCAVKTDGSGYSILDTGNCSNINITAEWIYYFKTDELNYYRVRKDGTGLMPVE